MDNKLEIRVDTKDIKKRRRKPTTIPQRRPLDPKRPSIKDLRKKGLIRDKKPVIIIEMDGQEFKVPRVALKGGGICKKGMNKKAFGKNS